MVRQEVIRRVSKQWRRSLLVAIVALFFNPLSSAIAATNSEPCANNSESRQLDFWLGSWSIGGPGAGPSAVSKVYVTLDQCLVVESWDGGRGHRGENLFGYSPDDKSWHGMFADNMGRVHVFVDGKVTAGTAEFTGPSRGTDGKTVLNRVRIVRISQDKVEQVWEKSSDNGISWKTEFRGEYSRGKS